MVLDLPSSLSRLTVTCSLGRLRKLSQTQRRCSSVSLVTTSSQSSSAILGVGPADRTGKSSTSYWPGGSSTLERRRPVNPRDSVLIVASPAVYPKVKA
jgi:hypothetical protein